MNIKITGSGSYIPTVTVKNKDFSNHVFLNEDGSNFGLTNDVITEKFYGITGIQERKYAADDLTTSEIAFVAA
jgi:3-oxoacyl-[acyl-carrier-protein] synthase-3